MNPPFCFALIHSPLVGPLTWSLVAKQVRSRRIDVRLPELSDGIDEIMPYWKRHAQSVAETLQAVPPDLPIILTAHSGAGPLLPVIRLVSDVQVAAYLFVDAGIPIDGHSRLDLMALESPDWAKQFYNYLTSGGSFPDWSDEQLRDLLPDGELRQSLLAELRPRKLEFFTEPIPVFHGWPDAPCGYIRLSPAYDYPFRQAKRNGWAVAQIDAGHFHMLVEPEKMVEMMLGVISLL
jgi:hypothetical protein